MSAEVVRAGEPISLNAFEVQADPDNSYGALNSTSITRFNTELNRLPLTADVFTDTFMKDTAATSVEDMIQTYSAGAGYSGSDAGSTASGNNPGDRNSGAFIQLRGLQAPSVQRDGFMPARSAGGGYTNNYSIERVEIINGPQALLYGAGGAGGVMNLVSKQARLGKKPFGSLKFQLNQYGGKMGTLDLGAGNANVAVRVAVLKQEIEDRRAFIGGPLNAIYLQAAGKVFGNTILRFTGEHSTWERVKNSVPAYAAQGGVTADARNAQNLHYLLATNQITGASGGRPSGGGVLANGILNWDNVDSLSGWWNTELTINDTETLSADTRWNHWLSTQVAVGYGGGINDNVNVGLTVLPPNSVNNPLKVWALGATGSNRGQDAYQTSRQKGLRFSALATNDFFQGRVHSQTILGADFIGAYTNAVQYGYFQADANWHAIVNPAVAANNGRTQIPAYHWSIADGLVFAPLWKPASPHVTYNGVNYVRQQVNLVNRAAVSPANPLGTTPGGATYTRDLTNNKGVFGANYSQWMHGKLDSLLGFRLQDVYFRRLTPGSASASAETTAVSKATAFSFNVGLNYRLRDWLIPYVSVSESFNTPAVKQNNPYGEPSDISKARGEEAGLKVTNQKGTLSGSLALYHVNSRNEQYSITNTVLNVINPNGLNGQFGSPSTLINVDRATQGVQLTVTATPTSNWRTRFSGATTDGKIANTTGFAQVYNDQFHANAAGQVTYADGTLVYVPAAFNATRPTVPEGTAGATPLTIAMMSTPGNAYYANPIPLSGAITTSSSAARVLQTVDPVHGAILTGKTGLPISAQQINPGFRPAGQIVTSTEGEFSVGYPKYSVNSTNVYTFASGWLKNLEFGGTVSASWFNRRYYYYPNGVAVGAIRRMYYFPTQTRVDLLAGYSGRITRNGRLRYSIQANVNNLFNAYSVVILPNAISGYAGPNNATFSQQPRSYLLTTTVSF